MKLDEFENITKELLLLVRNEAEMGRSSFITNDNFTVYQRSPLETGVSRDSLGVFSIYSTSFR